MTLGWRSTRVVCLLALIGVLGACAAGTSADSGAPSPPSWPPTTAVVSASPTPSPTPTAAVQIAVPAGVTAGIVVYDRATDTSVLERNTGTRFRSASLVKLLIVLDHLWEGIIADGDRARLDVMLRSSDDDAATHFWRRNGNRAVVTRMVERLGLQDTQPPPESQPGFWGYTAISARDIAAVYRYLLDKAPAAVRDYVLDNLRESTKCGTDRYDQSYGIPAVFGKPWAVKQGWSGFGDRSAVPCTAPAAYRPERVTVASTPDMWGEVLHTTGVVGPGDRTIVVILSVHPDGTRFGVATAALNELVRTVPVPGAVRS